MILPSRSWNPTIVLGLIFLCATVGALTAVLPAAGALVPLALVALLVLTRLSRPWLVLLMSFLVLQDPLLFLVGGDTTPSGFVIKRLDEAFVYLIAGLVLVASRPAQRALATRQVGLLFGGCFVGMIVSTLIAGTSWAPALLDLSLFSKPFLLFAIGTAISAESLEVRSALRLALPLMMFVVLFGLVFLLAPALQEEYLGTLRNPDQRLGMLSAQGFFDGPGPYSWFCAATFAVAYAAYVAFGRSIYLHASMISAAFALLSWRRKSIGGIAAMVLVATIIRLGEDRSSRRRALIVLTLAVIVGATILAPIITSLWQYTVHEYGGDRSAIARLALHYTSLEIARDHFPFGTGLASFGSHASSVYYSPVYQEYGLSTVWGLSPEYPAFITDTFWPMVLGQGGIISLAPYVLFFVVLLRTFWKAAKAPATSREDHFLALCALCLIVGSLLESTSSHIYDSTMQSSLVMIPAGIAWSRFSRPVGLRSTNIVEL